MKFRTAGEIRKDVEARMRQKPPTRPEPQEESSWPLRPKARPSPFYTDRRGVDPKERQLPRGDREEDEE